MLSHDIYIITEVLLQTSHTSQSITLRYSKQTYM